MRAVARRRYMCASCSHVYPIPPCTWVFRLAHRIAASSARTAAFAAAKEKTTPPAALARAASHTAAVASSVATAMLAQWCLTAWKVAIGRPNWTRTLAYSAAMSVQARATPVASAARIRRARSVSVERAPTSTSPDAPANETRPDWRVRSRLAGTVTVTPAALAAMTATSLPTPTTMRSANPADRVVPALPLNAPAAACTSPPSATPAFTEPSARPGSKRAFCSSVPQALITAPAMIEAINVPGARPRPSSSAITTASWRP